MPRQLARLQMRGDASAAALALYGGFVVMAGGGSTYRVPYFGLKGDYGLLNPLQSVNFGSLGGASPASLHPRRGSPLLLPERGMKQAMSACLPASGCPGWKFLSHEGCTLHQPGNGHYLPHFALGRPLEVHA